MDDFIHFLPRLNFRKNKSNHPRKFPSLQIGLKCFEIGNQGGFICFDHMFHEFLEHFVTSFDQLGHENPDLPNGRHILSPLEITIDAENGPLMDALPMSMLIVSRSMLVLPQAMHFE